MREESRCSQSSCGLGQWWRREHARFFPEEKGEIHIADISLYMRQIPSINVNVGFYSSQDCKGLRE